LTGSQPKTFLVFTASYGQGHNRASEALAQTLQRLHPEGQVKIIDFLAEAYPRLNSVAQSLYLRSIKSTPHLYGQWYKQTDVLSSYPFLSRNAHRYLVSPEKVRVFEQNKKEFAALNGNCYCPE
jgi:UDP-N-acetylglucosamine:LPS N-acetylglucosamine transferase